MAKLEIPRRTAPFGVLPRLGKNLLEVIRRIMPGVSAGSHSAINDAPDHDSEGGRFGTRYALAGLLIAVVIEAGEC